MAWLKTNEIGTNIVNSKFEPFQFLIRKFGPKWFHEIGSRSGRGDRRCSSPVVVRMKTIEELISR
jgi:hypothetical protein